MQVRRCGKTRELVDGGGFCSPGSWPPEERLIPAGAIFGLAIEVNTWFRAVKMANGPEEYNRKAVAILTGAERNPFEKEVSVLRKGVVRHAETEGSKRDGLAEAEALVMDLQLLDWYMTGAGDPDAKVLMRMRKGVKIGADCKLPRTPAVFARKTKWKLNAEDVSPKEWKKNYKSARDNVEEVKKIFKEQLAEKMFHCLTYKNTQRRWPGKLHLAALACLEQGPGNWRVVHDGTHTMEVNIRIRVIDQEVTPGADDAGAIMETEAERKTTSMIALIWDVSKAHRRIPVAESDWGMQSCSLRTDGSPPQPEDIIWCNTVGTYGIASAGAWWGRLGALLVRFLLYVGHYWARM